VRPATTARITGITSVTQMDSRVAERLSITLCGEHDFSIQNTKAAAARRRWARAMEKSLGLRPR
jgi:hypothetical protein